MADLSAFICAIQLERTEWEPFLLNKASTNDGQEDNVFVEAFVRVRGRYSNDEWSRLSSHEIAEAVLREIDAMDAEKQSHKTGGSAMAGCGCSSPRA
jgi:hypothetical protein